MGKSGRQRRIALVTVHGTGDTASSPVGEKWFQSGSTFTNMLLERLAARGVEAEVVPHLWSGANSALARERGAMSLARMIRKTARTHSAVHVIGHSHGGNVANDAATMLNWRKGKSRRSPLTSITTVGTPFFRSALSPTENLGGVAFLVVLILSTLALMLIGAVASVLLAQTFETAEEVYRRVLPTLGDDMHHRRIDELQPAIEAVMNEHRSQRTAMYAVLAVWAVFATPMVFILPVALTGLRRILRLRRKLNQQGVVHSIWHPNDEAISFLQRVEKLPIEPFPRGSLWRVSRTGGIVWGIRAVVATFLLGVGVLLAGVWGYVFPPGFFLKHVGPPFLAFLEVFNSAEFPLDDTAGVHALNLGLVISGTAIFGAPIFFLIAYAIARLVVFGLALEVAARGFLNHSISGVLRGMAFGQDGDERLGEVSTCSHTYGAKCVTLDGEIAERMRAASAQAADRLIEKYRWALFTVGPDTNGVVQHLATDAMTWESLIHTTYFDQDEVAAIIADHIANEEGAPPAGVIPPKWDRLLDGPPPGEAEAPPPTALAS